MTPKFARITSFTIALAGSLMWVTAVKADALATAQPWHATLSLGGDGYWRHRIPLVLKNHSDHPLAGDPVEVKIGTAANEAQLVGSAADALRVVNQRGTELLWTIADPAGLPVRRGPIPSGSVLKLPAECAVREQTTCFLYFDNSAAWAVPDFLDAGTGLRNGGLEAGEGDVPTGWQHDNNDPQHRTAWVEQHPHGGRKCLKTMVAAGAEPTWIATRQSHIRITGGARCVLRAWVKAVDVKGFAGWYIHVGNASNSMLISPTLSGGGGTYPWKEVTTEFTAPPDADVASVGTVLRGTGTAWFDDVSLECLSAAQAAASVEVQPPQLLSGLREVGDEGPWPSAAPGWDYRFAIRVFNPTAQATDSGLISVDLSVRWHG